MKKILTLTLFAILLSNSHSNILSMKNISPYDHKTLIKALIGNENSSYSKEQFQKNIELFKFALENYKPIYTDDEYKKEVQNFYKKKQDLYQQELIYLINTNRSIKSILTDSNYSGILFIYLKTFNPKYKKCDYFGHDYYHQPHAIKVRSLLYRATRNKIAHLLKTEFFDEYNQAVLENIDDGFLLAATLMEGLKWTKACVDFLQNKFSR